MKTISALFLFTFTLATRAQDELLLPTDSCTPRIVYNSAVVYNAPVVYNMPVVYNGPVFYGAFAPDYYATDCESETPSIVIHIGGGRSHITANFGYEGSAVIHFGGEQAASQGYYFGHR